MALHSVSTLLDDFGYAVWRADVLADAASTAGVALPSGHAALDAQLPGGGWPVGGLCEILQTQSGLHEWRLLLPALQQLKRKVVLVGAPYVPFGPGLVAQGLDAHALLWLRVDEPAERLWAAEQVLRCAGVAALLVWLPKVRADHLRRLHMAAHAHAQLLFVMRPDTARNESSPAVLRLLVEGAAANTGTGQDALQVQVIKRRGPPLVQSLSLPARHAGLSALLAVSAARADSSGRYGASSPAPDSQEHTYALDCLASPA